MKKLYNRLVKLIKDNSIKLLCIFLCLTSMRLNILNAKFNKLINDLERNVKISNENTKYQGKLNYVLWTEIKKLKIKEK